MHEVPGFPGSKVRIQPSQAKHKLFIGGIPHELTRDSLRELLEPVVKGGRGSWVLLFVPMSELCCAVLCCAGGWTALGPSRQAGCCVPRTLSTRSRTRPPTAHSRTSPPAPPHTSPPVCHPPRQPLYGPTLNLMPPSQPLAPSNPLPPCLPGPPPLAPPPHRLLLTHPPGLEEINMVKSKDPAHPEQNRGFAFLEFYNSACASAAKSALSQPNFK